MVVFNVTLRRLFRTDRFLKGELSTDFDSTVHFFWL